MGEVKNNLCLVQMLLDPNYQAENPLAAFPQRPTQDPVRAVVSTTSSTTQTHVCRSEGMADSSRAAALPSAEAPANAQPGSRRSELLPRQMGGFPVQLPSALQVRCSDPPVR